tara:strand:- start:324 stop:983 length:660 start_codon:yes stop_codon:yes gene_type:complete
LSTILITGCNRGIGLQLATQFQKRGDSVIGVCRIPSKQLSKLGIHVISGIDISDGRSVKKIKEIIEDLPLDIIINNAGILKHDEFKKINYDELIEQFCVNALGPLRVCETLESNLKEGSKIIIISSRVGSISDNSSGGFYGYRASKTAVNQIGMNLMHEFKPRGISVALLHPGFVATDMTADQGIAPEMSAKGLISCIDKLDVTNTGKFWHAKGYKLPW